MKALWRDRSLIPHAFRWHYSRAGVTDPPFFVNRQKDHDARFEKLRQQFSGQGLQIGTWQGRRIHEDFVILDKYDDNPIVDHRQDCADMSDFHDGQFDWVVCMAVLEHVPDPAQCLKELHRVLKPGGCIWVELPFIQPYHQAPEDYWRVTLPGLRLWMKAYQEVDAGYFGIPLYCGVWFEGIKASS